MRTSLFKGYSRQIACRAALLMIMVAQNAGAGSSAGASGVPWSSFTLQASRLGSTATAAVTLEVLSAATEIPKFIDSTRSQPFPVSGAAVQKLSVTTILDILGGHRVRFENQLWLDPLTHTPLYLIRTRFGLKDYYQRFRFTREGVFRLQREPASAEEVEQPPEFWTRLGEHFYSYPPDQQTCSAVVETSMLIPLIGQFTAEHPDAIEPFCVFHKRQVHRVSVRPQAAQMVPFDYMEKRAGQETRRVGTVSAVSVSIASRPIGSYRGDVEDFIRNGSRLYLSPEGRTPLVVSGELPLIGRVEMQLREIHLK